ncbi:MAG: preQ(1) synthase [Bacteriovoracaceae bacterium]|nr:preQ(1) synthase [Bacteriovoracaceae bacterium]
MSVGRNKGELKGVKKLGSKDTDYKVDYDPTLLESFPNKNAGSDQWISLLCTEFTSLCPITGQPDFAKIFINYIADKKMVESKALKLYLFSFRNHGDFHEDCIQKMANDLTKLLAPKYLEVIGEFTPRGGIAIVPFSSFHNGNAEYKKIYDARRSNYGPGKYTVDLSRIY